MGMFEKVLCTSFKSNGYGGWSALSAIVFITVAVILIAFNLYKGQISSLDTATYSELADGLLLQHFDWIQFATSNPRNAAPIYFYGVPITTFALAKLISITQWKSIVFGLNLLLIPISLYLVRKILQVCGVSVLLVSASPIMFLFSSDFPLWPHYILSDTIYVTLLLWVIYLVLRSFAHRDASSHAVFILAILLLIFSRPASPPVIVALLFSYSFPWLFRQTSFTLRLWLIPLLGAIFVFVTISAVVMLNLDGGSQITHLNHARGDTALYHHVADSVISMLKQGLVIHDRPETWIDFEGGFISVLTILCTRFAYFFAPYIDAFSLMHTLINLSFFLFVGSAIVFGEVCASLVEAKEKLNQAKGLLVLLIVSVAVFHSVTLIDYDWRYRYPVIAPMIVLAFIELNYICLYFSSRKTRLVT
jgi:hypothetical protein